MDNNLPCSGQKSDMPFKRLTMSLYFSHFLFDAAVTINA